MAVPTEGPGTVLREASPDAVLLDTDGVITDTARVHAAAWKRVFDDFLRRRARERGEEFRPFDPGADYLLHVDGRPRADGVRAFLASRGIDLPEEAAANAETTGETGEAGESGGAGDAGEVSVAALADAKDAAFLAALDRDGVTAFPSTVALVRRLRRDGIGVAAVSASRNCARVLAAAGVDALFDVRVDGVDAARLDLAGKPAPDLFLEAARRLGARPGRTAVVEDSLAGVEAGRRGGFALVVGVDRAGQAAALAERGADVVVSDLAELEPAPEVGPR
ncbi:HAD family phosphatase [Nocardiopsis sp. NRRL B-16309]|uniref:HAD family hydrolase n=1 Tax=Nocardiopsis sp. NRRL B-16309 TaxID=1519494 RepID=UPI0006ADF278|nr:HAD-IA family hydrolase [Nocardiopsis sp. NRRL B-16309]KOX23614.1 hydrolase [Nocardiopsis sp. NRRL B-16309]